MLRPSAGSGFVISWAGMRGIVSLAAALALPSAFPYRDLIVLSSFFVVLGTLVIQGLTLKPLLRFFDLHDNDPIAQEVSAARECALQAALATIAAEHSPVASAFREELTMRLGTREGDGSDARRTANALKHRAALDAARQALLAMRASGEIGDDAFHVMEEELDWHEMAVGSETE
jgi:hypothetical protein